MGGVWEREGRRAATARSAPLYEAGHALQVVLRQDVNPAVALHLLKEEAGNLVRRRRLDCHLGLPDELVDLVAILVDGGRHVVHVLAVCLKIRRACGAQKIASHVCNVLERRSQTRRS